MKKAEIMSILPHRDDMLLIDEVERDGDSAVGKYHVRGDEFFLNGHFPGNPARGRYDGRKNPDVYGA